MIASVTSTFTTLLVTPSLLAKISTTPELTAFRTPLFVTVAILASSDFQVTDSVTGKDVSSLNIAVAVKGCICPLANEITLGVNWIDVMIASVTSTFTTLLWIFPIDACIFDDPISFPFASPVLSIGKTFGSSLFQVTSFVISTLELSE